LSLLTRPKLVPRDAPTALCGVNYFFARLEQVKRWLLAPFR
jgi:hypothetical protein